jgi:hypothetical protein
MVIPSAQPPLHIEFDEGKLATSRSLLTFCEDIAERHATVGYTIQQHFARNFIFLLESK